MRSVTSLNGHLEQVGVAHSQGVHDGDVAVQPGAAVLENHDRDARRRPAIHLDTCPRPRHEKVNKK